MERQDYVRKSDFDLYRYGVQSEIRELRARIRELEEQVRRSDETEGTFY